MGLKVLIGGACLVLASCGEAAPGPTPGPAAGPASTPAKGAALPADAAVWDDPQGAVAPSAQDTGVPLDAQRVWAYALPGALHLGARFSRPLRECWSRPDAEGRYASRPVLTFYVDSDGDAGSGGKPGPTHPESGFDRALMVYASARFRERRDGELREGIFRVPADRFDLVEPAFVAALHHVPAGSFGEGDPVHPSGPWRAEPGSHARTGEEWVEFVVPLEALQVRGAGPLRVVWVEHGRAKVSGGPTAKPVPLKP